MNKITQISTLIITSSISFFAGLALNNNNSTTLSNSRKKETSAVSNVNPNSPQATAQTGETDFTGHQKNSNNPQKPDESNLVIPLKNALSLLKRPVDVNLLPNKTSLLDLGLNELQIKQVTEAFEAVKLKLEAEETQNAKLLHNETGDYYSIPVLDMEKPLSELESVLKNTLGAKDWRVNFLMESLKNAPTAAGFGKYRQEIAIEEEKDSGGSSYQMLTTKYFDKDGFNIGSGGFQVRELTNLPRYNDLFKH